MVSQSYNNELKSLTLIRISPQNLAHFKKSSNFAAESSQDMAYTNHDKLEWTLIFVAEFGRKFGLTIKQAFNYLSRYQGIAFVENHYDYVHTQSFASMVNDIAEYCHSNGGALV